MANTGMGFPSMDVLEQRSTLMDALDWNSSFLDGTKGGVDDPYGSSLLYDFVIRNPWE